MTWVRLDDGFSSHPKTLAAGPHAVALLVAGLCWCSRNLTDGVIHSYAVPVLLAESGTTLAHFDRLVTAGFIHRQGNDWVIHDFLDWNPSREQVTAARAANRVRQTRHRHAVTGDVTNAAPDPTRPISYLHPPTTPTEPVDNSRGKGILDALVSIERAASNGTIRNPAAWSKTVRARVESEHGERITELVDSYPDAPDSVIVAAVLGDTHSLRYYQDHT